MPTTHSSPTAQHLFCRATEECEAAEKKLRTKEVLVAVAYLQERLLAMTRSILDLLLTALQSMARCICMAITTTILILANRSLRHQLAFGSCHQQHLQPPLPPPPPAITITYHRQQQSTTTTLTTITATTAGAVVVVLVVVFAVVVVVVVMLLRLLLHFGSLLCA